jgi:hypothetical protein
MTGRASAAESRWKAWRVPGSAPDQTETDSTMMFIAENPATARARTSSESRPSDRSSSHEARWDEYPIAESSSTKSGIPSLSPRQRTTARRSVRLTRAASTPGRARRAFSILAMHAAQPMSGTDSTISLDPPPASRLAAHASSRAPGPWVCGEMDVSMGTQHDMASPLSHRSIGVPCGVLLVSTRN